MRNIHVFKNSFVELDKNYCPLSLDISSDTPNQENKSWKH